MGAGRELRAEPWSGGLPSAPHLAFSQQAHIPQRTLEPIAQHLGPRLALGLLTRPGLNRYKI